MSQSSPGQTSGTVLFTLACCLAAGALLGFWFGSYRSSERLSREIAVMKEQIAQAKPFFPSVPDDVRSVRGSVAAVDADGFTLNTLSINPFEEMPQTLVVAVGPETMVILLAKKDDVAYAAEAAAYQEAVRSGASAAEDPVYPSPFTETPGAFADIAAGLTVEASAAENIRNAERFTAAEVRVYTASPPGPPSP